MEAHPVKKSTPQIINNNDVLIIEDDIFMVDNIGNKRFIVIIGIFRKNYMAAIYRGDKDESKQIVRTIVDGICDKAVPNGHFFEYDETKGIWCDLGNEELARQKVRISLLDNMPRIKSNSNNTLSKNAATKSEAKSGQTSFSIDNYFSNQSKKDSINLSDPRFEVKDTILLNNMCKLTKRRIITAKIRRTHTKKAVLKDNCYYYPNYNKMGKRYSKRSMKGQTPEGTKNSAPANINTRRNVSKVRHENIDQSNTYCPRQFNTLLNGKVNYIDRTKRVLNVEKKSTKIEKRVEIKSIPTIAHIKGDKKEDYTADHLDIHAEIEEILGQNESMIDFQQLFSDDDDT